MLLRGYFLSKFPARNMVVPSTRTFSVASDPPANPIPTSARPKKAVAGEVEQRVMFTTKMILDGRRKHEIKRFFRTQYGVGARQVETYIRLAREKLAEPNGMDVAQMRAEQYARFMELARNAKNDGCKIAALKAAGALYGLDAPQKVAETTSDGKDVNTARTMVEQLTVDELRVLSAARRRLASIVKGDSPGEN